MSDMESSSTIHIRTPDDGTATKAVGILEALGYRVERDAGDAEAPTMVHWATIRIARRFKLSSREHEILGLVLRGTSVEEIGVALGLSKATITWHMGSVLVKTGSATREDLVRLALFVGVHPQEFVPPVKLAKVGAGPRKSWP